MRYCKAEALALCIPVPPVEGRDPQCRCHTLVPTLNPMTTKVNNECMQQSRAGVAASGPCLGLGERHAAEADVDGCGAGRQELHKLGGGLILYALGGLQGAEADHLSVGGPVSRLRQQGGAPAVAGRDRVVVLRRRAYKGWESGRPHTMMLTHCLARPSPEGMLRSRGSSQQQAWQHLAGSSAPQKHNRLSNNRTTREAAQHALATWRLKAAEACHSPGACGNAV